MQSANYLGKVLSFPKIYCFILYTAGGTALGAQFNLVMLCAVCIRWAGKRRLRKIGLSAV
jgi:hypothetical protein